MSRAIMQQALDALEYHTMQTRPINHTDKAIESLKQELAKPEQVGKIPTLAEMKKLLNGEPIELAKPEQEPVKCTCGYAIGHPLVTSCSCKPRKPWIGLTDDEVYEIANFCKDQPFNLYAKEIENKLKEKNA